MDRGFHGTLWKTDLCLYFGERKYWEQTRYVFPELQRSGLRSCMHAIPGDKVPVVLGVQHFTEGLCPSLHALDLGTLVLAAAAHQQLSWAHPHVI